MKRLLLIYLVLLTAAVAVAQRFPPGALVSSKRAAASSGPTWFDIETPDNDDSTPSFSGTEYIGATITVVGTGNITTLRLRTQNSGSTSLGLKGAIYSNSGTLLSSGTATVASTDDDVYAEITLGTPIANSGSTTYSLAFFGETGDLFYYYKSGTGAMDAWIGKVYSSFPYDPIGTPDFDNLSRNIVAGAKLE